MFFLYMPLWYRYDDHYILSSKSVCSWMKIIQELCSLHFFHENSSKDHEILNTLRVIPLQEKLKIMHVFDFLVQFSFYTIPIFSKMNAFWLCLYILLLPNFKIDFNTIIPFSYLYSICLICPTDFLR